MAIPKIIHYCWFGGNILPDKVQKCIESWKRYCPDYKIICWNESNYDVNKIRYTKEAYKEKSGHLCLTMHAWTLYMKMEEYTLIRTLS